MSTPPVHVTIAGMLGLPADAPVALRHALTSRYIVDNPVYLDAVAHDRSTADLDETLAFYAYGPSSSLLLPRGDTEQVLRIARAHGVVLTYEDCTVCGPPLALDERVTLSPFQERAVVAMLTRRYGVLEAPPGAGKTIMAMALIRRRGQRTLFIVHTRELALQAIARAHMVLGLTRESGDVGLYGSGKTEEGRVLTVALVQSLVSHIPPGLLTVGHVILDEAHHAPAAQTAAVLRQLPARYLLGLTATPYRRDGLNDVIGWHLGPTVSRIDKTDLADRLIAPRVIQRATNTTVFGDRHSTLISDLCRDEGRNALIVADVAAAVLAGHRALVLTDRVAHTRVLTSALVAQGIAAAALSSAVPARRRTEIVHDAGAGIIRAVVATGNLVGEGFDLPALDRLYLVTPLSYAGRVRQYVGRIARRTPGKQDAVVVDYCDNHGMLWAQWRNRGQVYRADSLTIERRPAPLPCEPDGSRDRQTGKGA